MSKESAYLIKLSEETNNAFDHFYEKLGWNKKNTILKLLFFLKDLISELENGRELVIQVREEDGKKVIKEKSSPYEFLRIPN